MSTKHMTAKQLQVYGARIRLAWFRKAEELGSVKGACDFFGLARSEYYYWNSRWQQAGKTLVSLYDRPRTPHSSSRTLGPELTELILQVRRQTGYGKLALATVLARDYGVKVSDKGVNNVLRRAGVLAPKKPRRPRIRKLDDREYAPGEVGQMDVKHWKRVAYQYDIIDCATRIKYKRLYPGVSPAETVDFLEHALRFFGPAFRFQTIQTDNGMEFTYTQLPQVYRQHPVDIYLEAQGIAHHLIRASSPHLNGRIERSHGVDKAGFRRLGQALTPTNLEAFLAEDCVRYNTYRPHQSLSMQTPLAYLQAMPGYETATLDLSVLIV